MGWFKRLLGIAPKAVDNVLDKENGLVTQFGSWIGNQNFTPEEMAEMNTNTYKDVRKFVVDTLAESTDRSKSRRAIAVTVIQFYLLVLFIAGMTYPLDTEWSRVWIEIATSWTLGGLVSAISIFFFGSHALAKHTESKKQ